MNLEAKYKQLKSIINKVENVMVAFSGGVDSSLLLAVCVEVLGEKAIAVTLRNSAHRDRELEESQKIAGMLGAKQIILDMTMLDRDIFYYNTPERCYYCKKMIFSQIKKVATEYCSKFIFDGSNIDDLHEDRPGMLAIKELDIRTPLIESQLNKREIRQLSQKLGLPTFAKPSSPCLATRFPAGEEITEEKLQMVDHAETYLSKLGFKQVRVRYQQETAKLELGPDDLNRVLNNEVIASIVKELQGIGFTQVLLDLQGYTGPSIDLGRD